MIDKLKLEVTKFTIVGAANFILTLIVFTLLLKVFFLNYLLSLIAAWIVGLFFTYVLNFTWVFKPEQIFQFKGRFVKYFLASLASILLNLTILGLIVESTSFDPFHVQFFLVPVVIVFNFFTAKYWSLRSNSCG